MFNFEKIKSKYNLLADEEQKLAITHKNGPALVLAGPGSGKTTVIVARTIFLLECIKYDCVKERILTVAFNKAASIEMAERFKKLYKCDENLTHFSTFHSFCNKIIFQYERMTGKTFKRLDSTNIISKIYKDVNNTTLSNMELNKLANELSCIKNEILIEDILSGSVFRNLEKVFALYDEYKRANNLIDYDDMLYFSKEILQRNKDILNKVRKDFKYIQVDEGQDLSGIQMDILKLIARPNEENVFIVGDDDQSIYGFRGARPECILNINKYFKNCSIYKLERNYRSTKRIVELSGKFVKRNEDRYEKKHYTLNNLGKKPVCKVFFDDSELLSFIYSKISSKNSGTCGILFRNGLSAILPAIFLYNKGVTFSVGKLRDSFFEHWMVKELIDVFSKLQESGDRTKPRNYLNNLFNNEDYICKCKVKSEILFQPIDVVERIKVAFDFLVHKTRNWEEIIEKYNNLKQIFMNANSTSRIQLSTIHASKGLEYDSVFMIDLYKGEFPNKTSTKYLEEERRLFFVGMTRAKKNLYMMYPSLRCRKSLQAGLFFNEVKNLCRTIK